MSKELYEKYHLTNKAYRRNNQGLALLNHWRPMVELVSPIVEIGCGNGKLIEKLTVEGFDCTGLDCINNIYELPDYYMHDLNDGMLPFSDKQFRWLLCFDVLEHLPEDSIEFVLSEFRRVSLNQVLSIAHYGGPPLHLTVKDPQWWQEKIAEFKEHFIIDRYRSGRTKVSIFII